MAEDPSTVSSRAVPRRELLIKGGIAAAAATGAALVSATPASAEPLVPVLLPAGPDRLYDSRSGGGRLGTGAPRILSGDPIPEDFAYLLNITVTETFGSGFLSVYSAEIPWPGTSTLNWTQSGQTVANTAYTFIRPGDRGIAVKVGGGGSTHFVIDLTGILTAVDLAMINATAAASALASPSRQLFEATPTG